MTLTLKQRKQVLNAVRKCVLKHHFNVSNVSYDAWVRSFDERSAELMSGNNHGFQAGVQELLNELRSSHTGFYHERPNRLFPQHTINVTLGRFVKGQNAYWFFLDVFDEGPAQRAGIRRGDVLHRSDGVEYAPPKMPNFEMGRKHVISVSLPDGTAARDVSIDVPSRKEKRSLLPMVPPKKYFDLSNCIRNWASSDYLVSWFDGSQIFEITRCIDCDFRTRRM